MRPGPFRTAIQSCKASDLDRRRAGTGRLFCLLPRLHEQKITQALNAYIRCQKQTKVLNHVTSVCFTHRNYPFQTYLIFCSCSRGSISGSSGGPPATEAPPITGRQPLVGRLSYRSQNGRIVKANEPHRAQALSAGWPRPSGERLGGRTKKPILSPLPKHGVGGLIAAITVEYCYRGRLA